MNPLSLIFIALASLIVNPVAAEEQSMAPGNRGRITLPAGETVNKDYFAVGQRVEISGTVNGDVYVAGGQVLIDGQINGDLLAVGGTVNISGNVTQDARIAGGQVTLSGPIGRNLTIGSANLDITGSARIKGGLVAASGNLTLAAPVGKDVNAAAGNLTVLNRINGNLRAAAGTIRLASRASVGGTMTYWSDRPASIDPGVKVGGGVVRKTHPEPPTEVMKRAAAWFAGFILLLKLVSFVSTLIVGLVLIRFFPGFTGVAVSYVGLRPWASLGYGFLILAATPVLAGALLVSVVGIPLALLIVAAYSCGIYFARIPVFVWAGRMLLGWFGREWSPGWALAAGLFLYSLLTLIPIVGGLLTLAAALWGLGVGFMAIREFYAARPGRELGS